MAEQERIALRIDSELKEEVIKICDELGLTMSGAVTLFLKQLVIQRKIPFEIKAADPKE